jgi:hypothetical protein
MSGTIVRGGPIKGTSRTIVTIAAAGSIAKASTGEVYTVDNAQGFDLRRYLAPADITGRVKKIS